MGSRAQQFGERPNEPDDDTGSRTTIDTLHDLIETCRDGAFGFTACADHATTTDLKMLFPQRAHQYGDSAAELRGHVLRLGSDPEKGGSASGAMHRGWVALRPADRKSRADQRIPVVDSWPAGLLLAVNVNVATEPSSASSTL
jgi:hypothetical protein